MKNLFLVSLSILATSLSFLSKAQNHPDHVLGELIVQLKESEQLEAVITKSQFQNPVHLKSVLSEPLAIFLLTFNPTLPEHEVLASINAFSEVKAVQFNHYVDERILEPNDQYYTDGTQWDMNNTGQGGGLADADIDAPEAWELCTGGITTQGDTVVVAVVDGGFFLNHEDINFWKNYQEIAGNGIDDDNNGYIDDINGWNASGGNANITSSQHGTHVSGTVGAKGNNSLGVAGVNWNAKVMAVMGSSGTESVVVAAYAYVFKQRQMYNQTNGAKGAFVVATNSSFGVNNGNPVNYPIWCGMYDSLGAVGILSAGATANANFNIDATGDMPTACPQNHLISVTNTTRSDLRNTGAAYGLTTIDLGAPGTSIQSTTPNNAYASLTGTSMATPHVAGAVGLMISAACPSLLAQYKSHPDSMALVFKQFMMDHVDQLNDLQSNTVSGGRLNIYNSLVAINEYCALTSSQVKQIANRFGNQLLVRPNPAGSMMELCYHLPQAGASSISIYDLTGRLVQEFNGTYNSEGFHTQAVNLSNLHAGIYYIQVTSGSYSSNLEKLVRY